jgi:hypothetical protein
VEPESILRLALNTILTRTAGSPATPARALEQGHLASGSLRGEKRYPATWSHTKPRIEQKPQAYRLLVRPSLPCLCTYLWNGRLTDTSVPTPELRYMRYAHATSFCLLCLHSSTGTTGNRALQTATMAEVNHPRPHRRPRPRPHKIVYSHHQAYLPAATIRSQTHSSAATLHSHPHDFSKGSNRTYTTFASPRSTVTIINGDLHGRLTMAARGGVVMTFSGAQVNVVRHGGMGVTPPIP